ncbi:hypothetical protein CEXT_630131 [Caerostris extrusa]|uniref:Uncharacterized protein n=1 Tax=Caerostris extrusa TaxID=172846 RepID=A0AAV4YEW7_CAEEX|nr:hypothetical protein CEXT_630131 [Caerostris extrusa]
MNCGCPGTPKEKALQKHAIFKECNSSSISSKKFCASKDVSEILSKATSKQYNINNKIPKGNKYTEQNSCNLLLPEITDRKENVLSMLEAMLDISQKESYNVSNTYTEISSGKPSTLDVRSNNSTETFSTPIIHQNLASKELILKKSNPPKAEQCTNRAASSSVVKTSLKRIYFVKIQAWMTLMSYYAVLMNNLSWKKYKYLHKSAIVNLLK